MNANDFPEQFLNEQQAKRAADSRESASIGGAALLFKEEVYQIIGAAMEVLNGLGHGLHEKPYENALVVEFGLRKIPFVQQPQYGVLYKTVKVGEYVPDLIAFNAVVVDAKVIDAITDHERGQMLNYLRITGLKVGVILNFKRAKLQFERIVLETNRE
jgi:GxxExxY protein